MTLHQVVWTKKAVKNLTALPKQTAKRIIDKVDFYSQEEKPLNFAKLLRN